MRAFWLPTGALQGCVGAGDDAGAAARSDWHGAGRAHSQRLEGGANCTTLCAERHLSKHSLEWSVKYMVCTGVARKFRL